MAMREEFERSGKWLFQRRSYLPILFIVISLLALWDKDVSNHIVKYDEVWEVISLLVCFFGLAIRIFTIGYVPKSTSGRNTKEQVAESLNTTGIYSIVRHPLYLGNFFMWFGVSIFPHTWWLSMICVFVFWLYYERIMFAEEEFLRKEYGDEYLKWAGATPAFFPRVNKYIKPDQSFSLKTVLRQEQDGFFAIILVLSVFDITGNLMTDHKIAMDLLWAVILAAGIIIWTPLKVLKKKTKVLNVTGR